MEKKIYILGIAIICLVTLIQLPDAYYHKVFRQEDLKCEIGKKFQVDEEDSKGGLFVAAPKFSFEEGDYLVTVSYAAQAEGSYIKFHSNIGQEEDLIQETHGLPVAFPWGAKSIPLHLDSYTEALRMEVYYGGEGNLRLFDITVDGLEWRPQDVLAFGILALACYLMAGFFLFREKGIRGKSGVYLTLLASAIFSSYPYFTDNLMKSDDILFHLMRIVGLRDGLLSGQFPVRVYPSAFYGTGCSYSMFYPDLFLYLPALLCVAGCSVVVSVQIFGFLLHFAAAAMYYAAWRLDASKRARLLSSMLYVFCAYFNICLYFRFDLGEAIALCFFPLVICGFYTVVFEEEGSFWPLCLGMAGLVMSHMLSAMFAVVFLLFFGGVFIRRVWNKKVLINIAKAAIVALGLCAWFLAPFARVSQESNNIILMQRATDNAALNVGDLLTLFGGGGESDPRNLGFLLIFGTVVCVYCVLGRTVIQKDRERAMMFVLMLSGVGTALCATPLFPWKAMMRSGVLSGITALIQFPWRLLGLASAFLALSSGMAFAAIWRNVRLRTLLSLVFAVAFVFFAFSIEDIYWSKDPYISRGDAVQKTAIAEDYLHQKTETKYLKRAEPNAHGLEILQYEKKGSNIYMEINAKAGSYVDTSLLFFTGYKAFDGEGNKMICVSGENNRLRLEFPEGYQGEVTVRYTGITRWRLSDLLSLLTLFAVIFFAIRRWRKKATG